jgi:hypothetical protein
MSRGDGFTSHVLLAFKYNESIAPMWFAFLIALLIRMRISNYSDLQSLARSACLGGPTVTYTFNRTKSSKLTLKVLLICIVAQARHNQGFEGVATNVGILSWNVCSATISERVRYIAPRKVY